MNIEDARVEGKCRNRFECLFPGVTDPHIGTAEVEQISQGVGTVTVVVNHENPKCE